MPDATDDRMKQDVGRPSQNVVLSRRVSCRIGRRQSLDVGWRRAVAWCEMVLVVTRKLVLVLVLVVTTKTHCFG